MSPLDCDRYFTGAQLDATVDNTGESCGDLGLSGKFIDRLHDPKYLIHAQVELEGPVQLTESAHSGN